MIGDKIMVNTIKGFDLETIDQILANLKKDANYYNHGCSEEEYMRLERMEDEL